MVFQKGGGHKQAQTANKINTTIRITADALNWSKAKGIVLSNYVDQHLQADMTKPAIKQMPANDDILTFSEEQLKFTASLEVIDRTIIMEKFKLTEDKVNKLIADALEYKIRHRNTK